MFTRQMRDIMRWEGPQVNQFIFSSVTFSPSELSTLLVAYLFCPPPWFFVVAVVFTGSPFLCRRFRTFVTQLHNHIEQTTFTIKHPDDAIMLCKCKAEAWNCLNRDTSSVCTVVLNKDQFMDIFHCCLVFTMPYAIAKMVMKMTALTLPRFLLQLS